MTSSFRSFAIIPAAGESRRMGAPKLLLPWKGSTVIECVLDAWGRSGVQSVVVVIRASDRLLAERIRGDQVECVAAEPAPRDMKASILLGLDRLQSRFAPDSTDAVLIAPGDLPELSPQLLERVRTSYAPADGKIVVPTILGKRGHPVLFPWRLLEAAKSLAEEEGINVLLERYASLEVSCDDLASRRVWRDLDTPQDYEAGLRDFQP